MLGKLLLLDRLSDFNYIYMSDICSLTYSYILFDSFIQYILFDSPVWFFYSYWSRSHFLLAFS